MGRNKTYTQGKMLKICNFFFEFSSQVYVCVYILMNVTKAQPKIRERRQKCQKEETWAW